MNFVSYAQSAVRVLYMGIPLVDLAEGSSIDIQEDGGKLEKTEGTDKAAINISTPQGATVKIRLKETSPSHAILKGFNKAQVLGGLPGPLVIMSGTLTLHTLPDAFVASPEALSTGDKKQGSNEYVFMSTLYERGI